MTRALLFSLLLAATSAAQAPASGVPADTAALAAPARAAALPDSAAQADPFARAARGPDGPYAPLAPALAGVVWAAPDSAVAAVADLVAMRQAGVRAVRTGLVPEAVLAAADRLGIAVAQELPFANLPAGPLARVLPEAERVLAEALDRARAHPSARLFILARGADTSDPAAVPFFERLTALARERGASGTRTAYLTRFVDDDVASGAVDLVLLDAREADPFAVLARWRARHEAPAGLGAWGAGVIPGREGGWRRAGTEAHQARTAEATLDALATARDAPEAAFYHAWRDADERDTRAAVAGLRYGLRAEDGSARPAFDVVSGWFTGRQRVFAFDAGPAQRSRGSGLVVLIGWGLVLGLGTLLATSPRLGGLVPQYFGRRDLYREAVQKGYGLSGGVTAGLAGLLALVVGLVGATVLRAVGATGALAVATSTWEAGAQARLAGLLESPALLGALLAGVYAAWLLFNVVWVGILAGRRRRLRTVQALSLVVWTRWWWVFLLLGAMLIASLPPEAAGPWAATLFVLALVVEAVAAYRTGVDLMYVSGAGAGRALGLGFAVPLVLALVGLGVLLANAGDEIGFLWHLAVRS